MNGRFYCVSRFALALVLLGVGLVLTLGDDIGAAQKTIRDTPDGTVRTVFESLGRGQPTVLWEALPERYQEDVEQLIHGFAGKMDKDLYDRTFALVGRIATVLKDKKQFFLASSMASASDPDEASRNFDAACAILQTIADSPLANLESLKTISVSEFLDTTGADLMGQITTASKLSPQDPIALLNEVRVDLVRVNGDTAAVSITAPQRPITQIMMSRVDGKWLPSDLTRKWDESIAQANRQLDALSPEQMAQSKPQTLMMLAMVESMITQFEEIESQDQFDQRVGQMMGLMMMGAMGGPGPFGGAAAQ